MHTPFFKSAVFTHLIFCLCLASACLSNSAFAIHKCVNKGQVTYSDLPCPADSDTQPFTQAIPPPVDPAAAKARHQSNLKQLEKIDKAQETERLREQQLANLRATQLKREEKQRQIRERQCKRLDVQWQLARKRLSAPYSNRYELDKIKEKDLAEQYRALCK